MKINWLWDVQLTEEQVKKILKNEKDPRFYIYAEKLFSRVNNSKIAFEYVTREVFNHQWPIIKQRIEKDAWAKGKVNFWENIYKTVCGEGVSAERVNISQQIKNIRLQLGYTQEEMAKKLGVIQQYISKLENGRENLSVDTLKRIADVFNKKLIIQLN